MTGIEIDPKMPELKELADDLRKQSDELFVTGTDQMMKKNWAHGALPWRHWRPAVPIRLIVACVCLQRWAS